MLQKFFIVCVVILMMGSAPAIGAETYWPIVCGERHKILFELEKKYSEKIRWRGAVQAVTKDGGELHLVAHLFIAQNSWSFVLSPRAMGGDGLEMICILASGKGDSVFLNPPGLSVKNLGGKTVGHQ